MANPRRYSGPKRAGEDAPEGAYAAGLKNEKFATIFGQILATWVHIEDMMIDVLRDLIGGTSAPARQIFHSLTSNAARKKIMLICLQRSQLNAKKADIYEDIIKRFADLNDIRNKFIHGLWYTHESGRVFLSESAIDDFHYFDSREVKVDEFDQMNREMGVLTLMITNRKAPTLARLFASPPARPKQPVRRNKKEYRRSKSATPPPRPQPSRG